MNNIFKSIIKPCGILGSVILLNILIFIITLGFHVYCAVSFYRYGENPDPNRRIIEKIFIFAILYLIVTFSAFISIVILIIVQAIRKKILYVIVGICLIFVSAFYVTVSYNKRKPGIYYIFQGLVNRAKQDVDFYMIRQWAQSIDNVSLYDEWPGIPKENWPSIICKINPNTVFVKKTDESNIEIVLEWGGAPMGHWGLVIGSKDRDVPKSDIRQGGEYRRKIENGVYAWCEIKSTEFSWLKE